MNFQNTATMLSSWLTTSCCRMRNKSTQEYFIWKLKPITTDIYANINKITPTRILLKKRINPIKKLII